MHTNTYIYICIRILYMYSVYIMCACEHVCVHACVCVHTNVSVRVFCGQAILLVSSLII